MAARDALVVGEPELRLGIAADDELALDGEDLAQPRARHHQQAWAARSALDAGEVHQRGRGGVFAEAALACRHRQDAITESSAFRAAAGRLVMTASTPSAAS